MIGKFNREIAENAGMTRMMKIQDIYEDYGQLHEKGCELLDEGGSFDGCTCAMKSMVGELVNVIIGNLKKELADNERWMREVLTDFQIPMIELGYRYCELDKIHEYSVVASWEESDYWKQWLWHWLKFKHTKNIRLKPYHANWDNQVKILARYKGINAKTVAEHISKKIEKHRRKVVVAGMEAPEMRGEMVQHPVVTDLLARDALERRENGKL